MPNQKYAVYYNGGMRMEVHAPSGPAAEQHAQTVLDEKFRRVLLPPAIIERSELIMEAPDAPSPRLRDDR